MNTALKEFTITFALCLAAGLVGIVMVGLGALVGMGIIDAWGL